MSRLVLVVTLAVAAVLLWTQPAFACAVCGSSKADNDWAFGITTLVLSVMPPLLFGGMVFFVVRAYRKRAREDISTPAE